MLNIPYIPCDADTAGSDLHGRLLSSWKQGGKEGRRGGGKEGRVPKGGEEGRTDLLVAGSLQARQL